MPLQEITRDLAIQRAAGISATMRGLQALQHMGLDADLLAQASGDLAKKLFSRLPPNVVGISLQDIGLTTEITRPEEEINVIPENSRRTWTLWQIEEDAAATARQFLLPYKTVFPRPQAK